MNKINIGIISYGSRDVAIADTLIKNNDYLVNLFIVDKQHNPFTLKNAEKYVVSPQLDIQTISDFFSKYKIDFIICGSEIPIINGLRNVIEDELKIPVISPKKDFALEFSKVQQREILSQVAPSTNPEYKYFDNVLYKTENERKQKFLEWLKNFDNQVAIKPDKGGYGKGVGVWGDHFKTVDEAYFHFNTIISDGGGVLVEEKVEGEEFSLQVFSDGKNLVFPPAVRDYKRAFNGDLGVNTGGTGSYKDTGYVLPFMSQSDYDEGVNIVKNIHEHLKYHEKNDGTALRGVPYYMAFVCTKDGVKTFEINSRPGDPEIINLLPLINENFVDVCYKILEQNLTKIDFKSLASVVTYSMPMGYADYNSDYSGERTLDLTALSSHLDKNPDTARAYPGSMKINENGQTETMSSRTMAVLGLGSNIEDARNMSLSTTKLIDGPVWYRTDIASSNHIANSINNMKKLKDCV